jgi:ribosome-associated toxin RatA of RatAB toxin-antitoxin module
MGKITSRVVSSAPLEKLYRMGHETDEFPKVFPNLKSIRMLEKSDDGRYLKAEWTAQAKLIVSRHETKWVQEDRWDDDTMTCAFCCPPDGRGHFKYMKGTWAFKPHPKGTEMILDVDFAMDHPLITPMISRIIDGIMKKNNDSLLNGLSKKAERQ